MKKKIAILGSTGSIGKSTLDIIRKDKNCFDIVLLSANNNYKKLIQQAKEFNAKSVLINNQLFYKKVKNLLKNSRRHGHISKYASIIDVNDELYQPSFDFDHNLRKKYPALKDAYDHYQNVKQMCETREKEEDAS